ncbi:N-acyl homoserine lactonase family protein [Microcella alkalica]|uniref:Glyoxylase-like metal-dependent hydrolase (Beta-lactamase superfamily II) n=1 Tax=Microcella alkalica TaxID=355930 RepID=A0A839E3V5_9MICO|nr:N-acyl homoserine lactonase family protein [Microcella alkalica]MBA8847359.1 glyoxylase-like metal-dependent hydrolase (beta-lactamase superfamily II) [Microcella alkalica]
MSNADYSIWVLEYAHAPEYAVSGVLYGAHNEGIVNLPYGYIVLKSSDRALMVDVGYNYSQNGKAMADMFGVINWQSPATVLGEIGLTPDDITDVLVTHAHFDHLGNIEDFPNATFHIQQREFSQWLWVLTLPPQFRWLQKALNPDDMVATATLAAEGRLRLVDGDVDDVLPGIDLHAAFDTHTFGSQFITVKNQSGKDPWIMAGDLRYVKENVTGIGDDGAYVPVGLASGSQLGLLETTERMMQIVGYEERRIVPVHEDRLPQFFPSRLSAAGCQIVEITLAPGETSRVG